MNVEAEEEEAVAGVVGSGFCIHAAYCGDRGKLWRCKIVMQKSAMGVLRRINALGICDSGIPKW